MYTLQFLQYSIPKEIPKRNSDNSLNNIYWDLTYQNNLLVLFEQKKLVLLETVV